MLYEFQNKVAKTPKIAAAVVVALLSIPAQARQGQVETFMSQFPKGAADQLQRTVLSKTISSGLPIGKPIDHCLLVHGYIVGRERLNDVITSKNRNADFGRFWEQYFGAGFAGALNQNVCGDVTIVMQEAIETTSLAMTERTEEYLREQGCRSGSCAVFGHSKGGLIVTNMARRCMETTSVAGEETCRRIKKFYSASGNNLGASYGALIYGLYLEDPAHNQLASMQRQAKLFKINIDVTSPGSMKYVPGETNPMWVDISPIAPLEGGVPALIKNNIAFEHLGWLTGEYGAGATKHDFQDDGMRLFGCGKWFEWKTRTACMATGLTFASLHKDELEKYYNKGLEAWKTDPRLADPRSGDLSYLNQLSWESHQEGDGMAEFALSVGPCMNGGSAVGACTQFKNTNHAASAGSGPEVQADVIKFFAAP